MRHFLTLKDAKLKKVKQRFGANMAKPSHRLVATLAMLLSAPGEKFTVKHLINFFGSLGSIIDVRTGQRLFQELSILQEFGLNIGFNKSTQGKTSYFSISESSPLLAGAAQNSLKILLSLINNPLPESQLFELEENAPNLNSFLERIYVASETILLPAEENREVIATVYKAIQASQYLKLSYINSQHQHKTFEFYPQGVMFRGQNSYLIGKEDGKGIKTLAMYRIQTAELIERQETLQDSRLLGALSFREFCESQKLSEFVTKQPKKIKIKLQFFKSGGHLYQMKLSDDQEIRKLPVYEHKFPKSDDENYFEMQVSATVVDSRKLQEWILSFGAEVEVLEPLEFRQRIQNLIEKMILTYKNNLNVD